MNEKKTSSITANQIGTVFSLMSFILLNFKGINANKSNSKNCQVFACNWFLRLRFIVSVVQTSEYMCIICSSMSDKKETVLMLLMVTKTNQYLMNINKSIDIISLKSNPTHFSWPSRVPFDFGKHQVTNFKWVLFAHLFFNCFHLRFVLLFHRQRTQFLTNKKKTHTIQ